MPGESGGDGEALSCAGPGARMEAALPLGTGMGTGDMALEVRVRRRAQSRSAREVRFPEPQKVHLDVVNWPVP